MSDVSSAREVGRVPRKAERKAIELLADRDVQPAHAGWAIDILHNALDRLDRFEGCCQFHNHNCEPPSELCCLQCPETAHPDHADGSTCVLLSDIEFDGPACEQCGAEVEVDGLTWRCPRCRCDGEFDA
jgi:tRNA(Ile2) C34 agmatinyltransferase TiaS